MSSKNWPRNLLNSRRKKREVPKVLPTLDEDGHWVEHQGEFHRSISYIQATTSDVIQNATQARELGYGLGMFHHLISDLPTNELADTPRLRRTCLSG